MKSLGYHPSEPGWTDSRSLYLKHNHFTSAPRIESLQTSRITPRNVLPRLCSRGEGGNAYCMDPAFPVSEERKGTAKVRLRNDKNQLCTTRTSDSSLVNATFALDVVHDASEVRRRAGRFVIEFEIFPRFESWRAQTTRMPPVTMLCLSYAL